MGSLRECQSSGLMMADVSGDSTNAAAKLKTTACVGLVGDAAWSEARSLRRRCVVCCCCDFAAVHAVSVVVSNAAFLVQMAMAMVLVFMVAIQLPLR